MTPDQLRAFLTPVLDWFEKEAAKTATTYDDVAVRLAKWAIQFDVTLNIALWLLQKYLNIVPTPGPTPGPNPIVVLGANHPALAAVPHGTIPAAAPGAFPWAIVVPIIMGFLEMIFRKK